MTAPVPASVASFVQAQEALILQQYTAPDGTISVGWGHRVLPSDNLPPTITEAVALQLLATDVQSAADCVQSLVSVPLSLGQLTALTDFVYNVGCQAFTRSQFPATLALSDFGKAAVLFVHYVTHANSVGIAGLPGRRLAEQAMFLS